MNDNWFTMPHVTSKQRLFNFIVGRRGNGKTTGVRNYFVEQWLKNHDFQCALIRRYKPEKLKAIPGYLRDILKFYELDVKLKSNTIQIKTPYEDNYCDFCHVFALSADPKQRGLNFPNIKWIHYDEFLIDPKISRYLPSEVDVFLDFYDSLARPSDPTRGIVPVIFTANTFSANNPYFNYFNITLSQNKKQFLSQNIFAELTTAEPPAQENNPFYNIIKGSDYEKHSVNAEFILDNESYITKDFIKKEIFFVYEYKKSVYTAWINWDEGKIYCSKGGDLSYPKQIMFTPDGMKPNYLKTKVFLKGYTGQITKEAWNRGMVWYDSLKTKQDFKEIAKLCNF